MSTSSLETLRGRLILLKIRHLQIDELPRTLPSNFQIFEVTLDPPPLPLKLDILYGRSHTLKS